MKILILGAGVIGTASAWYLARDGHDVTVVDRQAGAGFETSLANGGQVSASHAEPWARPGAPMQVLRWLGREDAPLLFRLRADPAQWAWALRFLRECSAGRCRANTERIAALALYSRGALRELRAATGIAYDHRERGILHYYTDERAFREAREALEGLQGLGLDRTVKTVEEAIALEPALSGARERLAGAIYAASDESGDAHLFTRNLAALGASRGVAFRYGHEVLGLEGAGGRISGVSVRPSGGRQPETLAADAYVVALGSYSPLLTRRVGVHLPVYPVKGYSVTVDVADPARAWTTSLTDEGAKLVFSRLGERLRVAGTAELSGYSTELNPVRCGAILKRVRELFPGAGVYDRPTFWAGLRPSTPSNVPLIGATRIPNLYVNTGHGTLGWTLACGSAQLLADRVAGRKPGVRFSYDA